MISIIILYIFFASTFTFAKAALDYCPAVFLVAVRFLIAGILLLLYYQITEQKKENKWAIQKKDWGSFLQTIFFTFYLSFITDCWALQYISSAKACLIYNLSPFMSAFFAFLLYREKITSKQMIALFLAVIAYIPLMLHSKSATHCAHLISFAEGILIISVMSATYGWFVMKKLVVQEKYPSALVNGIGLLVGGMLAFVHSMITEGVPTITSHGAYHPAWLLSLMEKITSAVWLDMGMFIFYTFLLIFIAHIFCYNFYAYLLRYYSPTLLSLAGSLTPLFAAFLGWMILDEHLSWHFFFTITLVIGALYLFYQDEIVQK